MKNEMQKLISQLNQYRNAYYNENKSLVSDREYDMLFDRLVELEEKTGIVYANSPTVTVGYETASELKKVRHNHPMLSLGKTADIDEFYDYFRPHDTVIMAKMDGLTCSICYVDGKLVSAESRGNGEIGEDITHNARVFSNLPHEIPRKGELIVDGECIITYDEFERIKEREGTDYKNPRNLASGTVRQLDNKITASRNVKFVAWKMIVGSSGSLHSDLVDLRDLGFEVVPFVFFDYIGMNKQNMDRQIEFIKDVCQNEYYYPIDGIVGAFDDLSYGEGLGSTGHHPKHSLAYKFYQEENETTLLDIEWSTSRTGMVNPVAVFESIEIDGTTVNRATLNNVSIIKELELGIGDTITVIKANAIIPQITSNLTRSNTYEIPKVCPACGHPLTIRNDSGREMLYCINEDCPGIIHDKIANFASREGMNIVGISDERLRTLIDAGFVQDFLSLYYLDSHKSEIEKLPGFGKSSVEKLLKAIEDSKHAKLSNVIVALGIPGVGKSAAKAMAAHCVALKNDLIKHGGTEATALGCLYSYAYYGADWTELDGFGRVTSDAINAYLYKNRQMILALNQILVIEDDASDAAPNLFGGKSFCVTGKLNHYPNREALVQDIEKYGGKIVSSVTAKTGYLITNDPDSGSSKNKAAEKYGTQIITELDFIRMIKE